MDFGDGQKRSHICHCSDCRQATGSHYTHSISVPISQLSIEGSGELSSWTATDAIGVQSTAWFCKKCGVLVNRSLLSARLY